VKGIGKSRNSTILGIALLLSLICVTSFLFRGWLEQGMQMDEVNRVINVIPLLNEGAYPLNQATFSLTLFGVTIPIMYKEYISTAYILRYLPLVFFDDYLFGLRFLYWIYLVSSAMVLFLVLRSRHLYLAVFTPLLMVTAPLYYPEIRIGFADSLQILFLALGAHLLAGFVRTPDSYSRLFWGIFLLFFTANQMIYFSWVIVAMALATMIVYPRQWFCFARRLRNWVIFLLAASLGLVHFLVYNLSEEFPTASIFFRRIFFPDEYNKEPLDYARTQPFVQDIGTKLSQIPHFLGPHWQLSVAIVVVSFLVVLAFLVKWFKEKTLQNNRIYLLPFLVTTIILSLILISPKTTRAGHYVYLIPFLQMSVLTSVLLVGNCFKSQQWSRLFLLLVPGLIVVSNLLASNQIVSAVNRTGGTGLYSPAVFEFTDYLREQRIESQDVVFLTWGLHAQPYFLNKGDFQINQLVFELINQPNKQKKQSVLKHFFASVFGRDCLYFPLYSQRRNDIKETLVKLAEAYGGSLKLEKRFKEKTGEDVILLYRLDDLDRFTASFRDEIRKTPISPCLKIIQFGPVNEQSGRRRNLPMWFIADGLNPRTRVALDGLLLKTVYSGDHVTALVPWEMITDQGSYALFLYDRDEERRSEPVYLKIE